jgi:protein-L-isoaspartate(D-aspartate) O-methyltransferase
MDNSYSPAPPEVAAIRMLVKTLAAQLGASVMTPAIIEAFTTTPRHLFLDRYRMMWDATWYTRSCGNIKEHLARIYRDEPLITVVDENGNFASSVSQPTIVARFMALLDLKPGQKILEIGSGSGWMVALMSRIAGPAGRVYGVELIPELVDASRTSLRRLEIENCTIELGDGGANCFPGVKFDRVVFTAALSDLPVWIYDRVDSSGTVVAPFNIKESVHVACRLRREGTYFRSDANMRAFFVPMKGRLSAAEMPDARQLPFMDGFGGEAACGTGFLRSQEDRRLSEEEIQCFRAYLVLTDVMAFVARSSATTNALSFGPYVFGIYDSTARSLAVVEGAEFRCYGNMKALHRLERALQSWFALGCPKPWDFALIVARPDDAALTSANTVLRMADSAFGWTPPIRRYCNDA